MWINKTHWKNIVNQNRENVMQLSLIKTKENKKPKSTDVIKEILNQDITWYDYEELSHAERANYFQSAQKILHSDILQNEINHLIAEWSKFALTKAADFSVIRDLRMNINGLQLLLERLHDIKDPNVVVSTEDLNAAI